jgi:ABC-type lipoprotein release transport system permease subunit
MYFELAWRNVWRNYRRTLVIIIAVVIGVWSMVFLSAFSRGMINNMLENGKSVMVGDVQIHKKGYREDPSIEKSIKEPLPIELLLKKNLPVNAIWTKRIKLSAFVSNARHSTGLTLVGIDPEQEKHISFIGKSLVQGDYLTKDDSRGIIMGKALLEKFETGIGKKLIIMTRNEKGEISSKAFKIKGVFKTELEATEKGFLFITIKGARKLTGMKTAISEISISGIKNEELEGFTRVLKDGLDSDLYNIETWKDLLPTLEAYVDMFNSFMYIWYVVVFIAMGFGIVNTSLMAVFERVREFGLLRALGMKPWWVIRSVLTESFFILLVGVSVGNFLGIASVYLMKFNGLNLAMFGNGAEFFGMSRIIYPALTLHDFMSIDIIIVVLGFIVSLYPAIRAAKITPVEAMRE